ncbi:hypothetical protein [Bradyrhizobium tropiciagri]|uniref:hypothetical protein n=1 Tax=Bradyrhizobium tropiciagri TaxID=312253 RepID=UPI00067D03A9|nr:hypothetical protein [Bradyrhizobium tropiciagri]
MDEFLTSLGMTIEFHAFDAVNLGRIAQLINKTNQFNLTTRRYTQSEVKTMSRSPDCLTFQIRLRDRFGDNGVIGVVVARKKDAIYDIDTWLNLPSHRVTALGRKELGQDRNIVGPIAE